MIHRCCNRSVPSGLAIMVLLWSVVTAPLVAEQQEAKGRKSRIQREPEVTYPPRLPDGKEIVTDTSEVFLHAPASLRDDVAVADTPPTVDFLFYPGQDYPGKPWSNWGDGMAANGKYYSSIGDHLAIGTKGDGTHGAGNAFVWEYDSQTKVLRQLVDLADVLRLPTGHYTPGKIHGRLDLGSDGWLYFSTHRGSPRAAIDKYSYQGDWILRSHPSTGRTEIIAHAPIPKHSVPTSILDPERLVFYGSTAAGPDAEQQDIQFFAYDIAGKRLIYAGGDGPARCIMLAQSTGRVYYVQGKDDGPLMRFDPATDAGPVEIRGSHIGARCATAETADGHIYTVSLGQRAANADVWSFDTRSETVHRMGTAAVGEEAYVASIDADPSGRYLYYVPGAHGGSFRDGSPVVRFDVVSGKKTVLAFLEPYYTNKYGFTLKGTYSTAVDPAGDKLYITWNVSRGTRAWDCCALTVIHLPKAE